MRSRAGKARFGSRRGAEVVEGMLVLVPLLAIIFLVIDTSWGLFVRATMQYAAQAGVNFAVAGGTGQSGQVAAIQTEVAAQSSGLLSSGQIAVNFYSGTNESSMNGVAGANAAGNIVQVQVNYSFQPLAPLFRSGAVIPLSATAAGVVQSTSMPTM